MVYDQTFTTAAVTPNPMGLFATVARWEGDRLTVHDASQDPMLVRKTLATVFDLPETDVRVLVPYLGGGFGAGLRVWTHVILAALAARVVGRPVKLVLTRPQMFTSVGHRPETLQRVRLGATRDGRLVAVDHESTSTIGALDDGGVEPVPQTTGNAYSCPNVATHDRRARLHIPSPHWMRAPGAAQGNFAMESALDELSYTLGIDPIELRLRNYTEVHPGSGRPWSSKALRECYHAGAERFGWARRTPEIGSMRDGNWLVGYGMAGVTFTPGQAPCQATVSIRRDGTAHVRSAATDLGTGTYTIATQVTAELLGLDIDQVQVEIGDSDLPFAPYSGGSGMATSLSGAIQDAVGKLVRAFLDVVADDESSPLRGRRADEVTTTKGGIHVAGAPSIGETYADILARHGLPEITADGERNPRANGANEPPSGSFAARFAEVRVDPDLGTAARHQDRVGPRRGPHPQRETGAQPDDRRRGHGHRNDDARRDRLRPRDRSHRQCDLRRLPDSGQRGRARPRRRLRRHARHGAGPSGSRASARSPSSAYQPPSPTPSTTPPAGASDRCRSPSSSCCEPGEYGGHRGRSRACLRAARSPTPT